MASEGKDRQGIRARIGRAIFKVPVVRRFYVRRLLSYMDKAQKKQRPLPSHLQELQQQLSRVPKHLRFATLEEALRTQGGGEPSSRQMRRAAGRQQRQGSRHGQRRPGTVMSRQWQPPPPTASATKSGKSGRKKR